MIFKCCVTQEFRAKGGKELEMKGGVKNGQFKVKEKAYPQGYRCCCLFEKSLVSPRLKNQF